MISVFLRRASRLYDSSCAGSLYRNQAYSRTANEENALAYFHISSTDVFWYNLEEFAQGTKNPKKSGFERQVTARLAKHNERIQKDWEDYNEGLTGKVERTQELQSRLEQDMLDNAFVMRTQEVLSALRRDVHASDAMAGQWIAAAQSASTFLQDVILFRDEPLEDLAESSDVAWLPSVSTIKSYRALLATSLSPQKAPLDPTPGAWAPLLALATPHLITASGSTRLQRMLMHKAFNRKRPSKRQRPQVTQVAISIGASMIAAANATLVQFRGSLQERRASTARALLARATLDPKVKSELHLLQKLKPPPQGGQFENLGKVQLKTARLLQHSMLSPNSSTLASVGSVVLQLLLMQLNGRSRRPMFRQPIPWRFAGPERSRRIFGEDYEFESPQFRVESLADYSTVVEGLRPVYGPCVLPPLPWVAPNYGCYHLVHTGAQFIVDVMRSKSPLQQAALSQAHTVSTHSTAISLPPGSSTALMSPTTTLTVLPAPPTMVSSPSTGLQEVFRSLNVLGSQPWSINSRVLEVVRAVDSQQLGIADVPLHAAEPPPPRTPPYFHACTHIIYTEHSGRKRALSGPMYVAHQPICQWLTRREDAAIAMSIRRSADAMSQRGMFSMQLKAANEHEQYQAIYFPHNLDFRGRAYPLPPHLNHMGNDLCRGLLQFSEARELGSEGFGWLLVHIANLFGEVDKESFKVRKLWALDRLPDILDSANAPIGGRRWWLQAEKPWSVLAACMDVEAAVRHGDVSRYASRLPVHQDGSCNGLQHYAALGLDEQGAAAVNLLDAEEPQDVYSMVVSRFRKVVADEAAGSGVEAKYAQALLPYTNRKLVKQTVMTTVYGVTMRGARDQVASRLIERGWSRGPYTQAVAQYAASRALSSLQGLFSSASIMTWLKRSAEHVSKTTNKSVQWKTPLGLPVVQPYFVEEKVKSPMDVVVARQGGARVHATKQATAFPPNFIHSLDATHMMMTARACADKGLSFAGVHDSFWTHACTVPQCRDAIREQFVALYKQPILQNLKADLESLGDDNESSNRAGTLQITLPQKSESDRESPKVAVELGAIPATGNLNLEEVKNSTYFFN